MTHPHDPLDHIDGCMDGTECPDAHWCREYKPEGCPLLDEIVDVDPEVGRMVIDPPPGLMEPDHAD